MERSGPEPSGEQVSHGFCCLAMGSRGHAGVGVHGKPNREVLQHTGDRFYIYPGLQGQGGKCVTQIRKLFITTKTKRKKKPGSYRKTKTL